MGMIPLKRLALPPQTAAIAGERGGVIMPNGFNSIINPVGMSGRDIRMSQRKIKGGA